MNKKRWIHAGVFCLLVAVMAWLFLYNRALEQALDSPETTSYFLRYSRASLSIIEDKSKPAEPWLTNENVLRVYNLSYDDVTSRMSLRGVVPTVVFRCPMASFTDRKSQGFMMYAFVGKLQDGLEPVLMTSTGDYEIKSMPTSSNEDLFVPSLLHQNRGSLAKNINHPITPSELSMRIWEKDEGDHSGLPYLTEAPIFQADWFDQGQWMGTVAWFESEMMARRAEISHS